MESFQALVDWLADNESAFSAVAAIAVISGVLYGALRFVLTPLIKNQRSKPRADAVTQVTLGDSQKSLAVLLFESLSNNQDDEFLASGITSEVIAHVTQIPNIRVSSRLSSFSFKTGRDDINQVAERLNARYILTGSLRRSETRIFVIAQLTDIQTQSEIWAQTYDQQIDDLFDVQHDIAKCIVGAVLGEVKLAEALLAGAKPSQQLDAWGLMQKAYHFWLTSFSPEGVLQAIEYLRKALEADPNYHSAKAALAMLHAQTMTVRITQDYQASAAEAKQLIEDAYQHAPNDIDVLENAGVVWQNLGEAKRAEMALRKAVSLAPLNLIARGYLALLLSLTAGQKGAREAIDLVNENIATAPKHPSLPYWQFFHAVAAQALGDHEQAIKDAKQCLAGQPGWVHAFFVMANSYAELGDTDAAKQATDNAIAINPYLTTNLYIENVQVIIGNESQAERFIGGLINLN